VEWWSLLRNGSLQRLSFFWDIHAKSVSLVTRLCLFPLKLHSLIQMGGCSSAVVSLAYGPDGLLVILANSQSFFIDIGQTIFKTSRATSNATPAEKENAASSHLELSRTPLQRGRKYKPPGQTPTRAHPHRAYPPPPEAAICSIRWAPPARAADGTGSSPQRSKGESEVECVADITHDGQKSSPVLDARVGLEP
jgi:hypothetical protein